jgi:hypothetical protein
MADEKRDDRSFDEVREELQAFQDRFEAVLAGRNIWVRSPAADGADRLIGTQLLQVGERPADPAYVPVPVGAAAAGQAAAAQLAASALTFLLPVAADPAQLVASRMAVRDRFVALLDLVLADAEAVARQYAALGEGAD